MSFKLFKEDDSTGEFIWSRILDCEAKLSFSLEMEDIPAKRKQVVAIRKFGGGGGTSTDPQSKIPHFLSDSSLSQDITSFDFHDSLMTQVYTVRPINI
jgi:hypothetical protein